MAKGTWRLSAQKKYDNSRDIEVCRPKKRERERGESQAQPSVEIRSRSGLEEVALRIQDACVGLFHSSKTSPNQSLSMSFSSDAVPLCDQRGATKLHPCATAKSRSWNQFIHNFW